MSMEALKLLREATGASITDCLKALKKTKNNIALAKEYLLNNRNIISDPIPNGYYAIDQYVNDFKQQVLEEFLALKDQFKTPIKKIEFLALDGSNLVNYVSIDEEEYGIQIDVSTNIPKSVDDKDYTLLSFCFQQLEKPYHIIKKPLRWGDHFGFPKCILLYELLLSAEELLKLLMANDIVFHKDIKVYVEGYHANEADHLSPFNSQIIQLYAIEEVAMTFNYYSFNDFIRILYKNINPIYYDRCMQQFKDKGLREILSLLLGAQEQL